MQLFAEFEFWIIGLSSGESNLRLLRNRVARQSRLNSNFKNGDEKTNQILRNLSDVLAVPVFCRRNTEVVLAKQWHCDSLPHFSLVSLFLTESNDIRNFRMYGEFNYLERDVEIQIIH